MKIYLYVCKKQYPENFAFLINPKNSRPIFNIFYCFWMFVNKLFTYPRVHTSESKRCFNVKSSTYYFHMKTNILVDFQICISVPLKVAAFVICPTSIMVLFEIYQSFKAHLTFWANCAFPLMIHTGKNLFSVQKLIEIQGWLLLTFSICLHNQLSSFNSIIVQMSEKQDSSNRQ